MIRSTEWWLIPVWSSVLVDSWVMTWMVHFGREATREPVDGDEDIHFLDEGEVNSSLTVSEARLPWDWQCVWLLSPCSQHLTERQVLVHTWHHSPPPLLMLHRQECLNLLFGQEFLYLGLGDIEDVFLLIMELILFCRVSVVWEQVFWRPFHMNKRSTICWLMLFSVMIGSHTFLEKQMTDGTTPITESFTFINSLSARKNRCKYSPFQGSQALVISGTACRVNQTWPATRVVTSEPEKDCRSLSILRLLCVYRNVFSVCNNT